ncbi:MAG TPA: HDIG domain-containing protein [Mucilaginibacter sp.]|jgi:phosphonate degradation associated HDIG domain protein|nr:HDIG domain-containing protein [Mucilaginibacter sp.]
MNPSPSSPQEIVKEIFSLYELHGDEDYIGEPVSQLEHMSQAAALAQVEGYDDEVVLAAFFHDIGHLCAAEGGAESMDGFGNKDHEELGSEYLLNLGFSQRIAELVKSHVVAKRYLTYKYPEYYEKLSPASRATLEFQGGRMNAEEAEAFEANPNANLIIKMREWDDLAKETNVPVENIDWLKQIALKHLTRQQALN